jgi:hypothetical protein
MDNLDQEPEEDSEENFKEEIINALTTHFRRCSRGRIVDLPRWAQ